MPSSCSSTISLPKLAGLCWFALVAPLINYTWLRAEESDPFDDSSAPSEGVLIMRDPTGTVVHGKISLEDEIYTVRGRYGNMQIPSSHVRMQCTSLLDAYARLHELTVKHQNANSHVTLARWCVTNQLDAEAIQELNAALELEPGRDDAQRMLRTLTETQKSDRKSSPRREPIDSVLAARQDVAAAGEVAALGGLSASQALRFTRRIQPLLVKTCATAGCHTRGSDIGFQLTHVVPGKNANRHASEQNLAAVLEQIDLKNPAGSRLLSVPRRKHGRQGRPVFAGQRGEEQLAELERWVLGVARDESRRSKAASADGKKSSMRQALATGSDSAAFRAGDRDPFAGKPAPATPLHGERRQRSMSDSTRDPFDPAAFNRQAATGRASR
jgi:hypothetical protein